MTIREFIKSKLHSTGLFPIARTTYRRLSPHARRQHLVEVEFYRPLLREKGLCFDVGANLGQRSEIFRKLGCRIVLVEPNPKCKETLDFLFMKDHEIEIVQKAVGAASGQLKFYTHEADATGSALPDWDVKVYGRDRGLTEQLVPVTTLDALIDQYGRPDFVKIDVEGFEFEVLNGLSQSLDLVSFEFHADDMIKTLTCLEMLSALSRISVRACDMDCRWLTPRTDVPSECLSIIENTNAKGDLFVWGHH